MKAKCLIVMTALLLLVATLFVYHSNKIQEDTLYSCSSLEIPQVQREEKQFISRVDALNQAYTLFLEGLGINLRIPGITMYINLYKDAGGTNSYYWLMSWYNKDTMESYSCTIGANDDKVINLFVVEQKEPSLEINENSTDYSCDEVQNVVRRFLNVLGKEADEYDVKIVKDDKVKENPYKNYLFTNRQNKKERFYMEIDMSQKLIVSYEIYQGDTK